MAYTFCGLKYVYWGYFKGYAKYGAEIRILVLDIGLRTPQFEDFFRNWNISLNHTAFFSGAGHILFGD